MFSSVVGVNGTVAVNMVTLEVAVEDIVTKGEQAGLPTAHQQILEKHGWKKQRCYGTAIQDGKFRPVSGFINGSREGYVEAMSPGYKGDAPACVIPDTQELTADQDAFRKFTKQNSLREKARIPEKAERVAERLASEGGGKETFSMAAVLQADILVELAHKRQLRSVDGTVASREMLEQALQIQEKHLGPDSYSAQKVAVTLKELGKVHGDLQEHGAAKTRLARALSIFEEHCGPDSLEVGCVLRDLGPAHASSGSPARAKQMLQRALTIVEQHCQPDDWRVAAVLEPLAAAHAKLGEHRLAKQLLERALQISEKQYRPDHPAVARTLMFLGLVHVALGEPRMAKQRFERALPILEQYGMADHSAPAQRTMLRTLLSAMPQVSAAEQTLPTTPANPLQGLMGAGAGAGATSGDPMAHMMAQSLAAMALQNPEMMQQLMDSPRVQQMMSNPERMRMMMRMNPQMNGLMERQPEMARMLEDSEVLRQSMQMLRTPSLMREAEEAEVGDDVRSQSPRKDQTGVQAPAESRAPEKSEEPATSWPRAFMTPEMVSQAVQEMASMKPEGMQRAFKEFGASGGFDAARAHAARAAEQMMNMTPEQRQPWMSLARAFNQNQCIYNAAEKLKNEGNAHVKSERYLEALPKYSKALENLKAKGGADVSALKLSLLNNSALCHLKTEQFGKAVEACEEALRIDARNFKALFRRGQAQAGMGSLSEAVLDVKQAADLRPSDKAISAELERLRARLRERGIDEASLRQEKHEVPAVRQEQRGEPSSSSSSAPASAAEEAEVGDDVRSRSPRKDQNGVPAQAETEAPEKPREPTVFSEVQLESMTTAKLKALCTERRVLPDGAVERGDLIGALAAPAAHAPQADEAEMDDDFRSRSQTYSRSNCWGCVTQSLAQLCLGRI